MCLICCSSTDRSVTVVDVKPAVFLEKPRVRAQFEWTRALCRGKGWAYEVFTGGDPIVLRNLKLLAVGRRPGRLPNGDLANARARLREEGVTLGKVLARKPFTCDEAAWRVAVFALVWSARSRSTSAAHWTARRSSMRRRR